MQDRKEYIETGLEHLSDKHTYNELQEDQTKQVAEEVTKAGTKKDTQTNPLLSTFYLNKW